MYDTEEAMLDTDKGPDSWPLTPRTVAVLVSALGSLINDLDMDLVAMTDGPIVDPEQTFAIGVFPRITWAQPQEWWREVMTAADRVRAGLATDGWCTPCTPAEEAAIYIAVAVGSLNIAHEDDGKLYETIADLADFEGFDFDWSEVIPALTGDVDIAVLWSESFDGIEDPDNETNRMLGIGDYRPQAWHRVFPRRLQGGSA